MERYSSIKDKAILPKPKLAFRFLRFFVKIFYRKPKVILEQELNHEQPLVFVCNHCKAHGPISFYLLGKNKIRIWCTNEIFYWKSAPKYCYDTFLNGDSKPKHIRWFYHLVSYLMTPLCIIDFRGADAIPVYYDTRLVTTYNKTAQTIKEGKDIVIFPETIPEHNEYLNKFNVGFIDTARFMKKKTGKEVLFVPAYLAPSIKTLIIGSPIEYNYELDVKEQRIELVERLQDEITLLAKKLPPHKIENYITRNKSK